MTKNQKIITSAVTIKGIPLLGWYLIIILTLLTYLFVSIYLSAFVFASIYIFIFIKSKKDSEYINILFIRLFKIGATRNINKYKGNRYVV